MTEPMTVEEPKKDTPKPDEDMKELRDALKALEIETPQDLQNMAHASSQVGKAHNEVGRLREEVKTLQNQIAMSNQPVQRVTPSDDIYGEQPVDLAQVIAPIVGRETKKAVNEAVESMAEKQQESMRVYNQQMQKIQSEPEYNLLKTAFNTRVNDPEIAMVQTRWGYINRDYSPLTRVQALLLDGHFILEHSARFFSGRFFNFNGTAGVWRRQAILDAGGWQGDG